MKILIALASRAITLDAIQEKLSEAKWKTIAHWIIQESKKPDSSDYWTKFSREHEDLLNEVTELLWNVKSIRTSPEPARATLDYLVRLYKQK